MRDVKSYMANTCIIKILVVFRVIYQMVSMYEPVASFMAITCIFQHIKVIVGFKKDGRVFSMVWKMCVVRVMCRKFLTA